MSDMVFVLFHFKNPIPMGKIKSGILGAFNGTVGPVVGSSWKGIAVIKSRPPRKRRRSTEGQLRQMAKLTLMTPFVRELTGLLNRTYENGSLQMSCFNKALSYNMRNAISGEYPALTINYPRVVLGVGDLLNPENVSVHSANVGQISITWTDNSGEGSARATDQAFVAVYSEGLESWITSHQGPQRIAGSYTLDVAAFSGKAVHTYIGFLSADAKFVSTSFYAGLGNIL
jgi:hypothetical protein